MKRKPDWIGGFLFVGNQLALDFLNTRPVQNGDAVELLPDFKALLRWFRAADLLSERQLESIRQEWGESRQGRRALEAIRDFREKLRTEVLALERGGTVHRPMIEELNRLMAEHPMRTRLRTARGVPSRELWFEVNQPEDLFAPLAYGSAILFSGCSPDRIRKCRQCILHFFDVSKKGTRRWCSMQLCGNRLKVAAYAARQKRG